MAPPTTGLAATDATLAAPDGTFIEVVKPWQTWQQADGEEWVKVEVDGSSPLLGAFYLAAGGSRLQRATRSVLEWLGLQGLYLSLSPADDQGQPRLDAMNQCVLLPNTYVRIKVRWVLQGWQDWVLRRLGVLSTAAALGAATTTVPLPYPSLTPPSPLPYPSCAQDLAVVKWTGSGFTELDSSKYASCYVPGAHSCHKFTARTHPCLPHAITPYQPYASPPLTARSCEAVGGAGRGYVHH